MGAELGAVDRAESLCRLTPTPAFVQSDADTFWLFHCSCVDSLLFELALFSVHCGKLKTTKLTEWLCSLVMIVLTHVGNYLGV